MNNKVIFLATVLLHRSLACIFVRPPRPTPAPTPAPSGPCRCGVPQVNRNRIIGGQPAVKNEYPWLVALFRSGSGRPFCGGVLLSSRTVLTAAHCKVYPNSQIIVHVGEHDVTRDDGEEKIRISSFTNHPAYNPSDDSKIFIY